MIQKENCAKAQCDKGAYSNYLAQRDCIACKSEEIIRPNGIMFISGRKSTPFSVMLNEE